ncbi:P27 family phage terminase small subunit [Fictibacillus nanhaiensis]|uniref:P27 family phage terminase small subunit n=1 Tax=Fictibacillus nanhaiensis TaxID=742169 RepID=UPI00203F05F9|nr:P27 family phage terminase small subunit [Fictibacillus nanhaiensis]MCM3730061.1 P27 family phage terminase small subunit [Fictibacillus nanhaiensis]
MEIPKPPSFLNADAKQKYYDIAEQFMSEGKWKSGDEIALSGLLANYQRWVEAEKLIKKNKDLCFETETGYRQQIPEISIANNAMKNMLAFIKEFSLTPRERIKLKETVLDGDGNEDDSDPELEGLIVK